MYELSPSIWMTFLEETEHLSGKKWSIKKAYLRQLNRPALIKELDIDTWKHDGCGFWNVFHTRDKSSRRNGMVFYCRIWRVFTSKCLASNARTDNKETDWNFAFFSINFVLFIIKNADLLRPNENLIIPISREILKFALKPPNRFSFILIFFISQPWVIMLRYTDCQYQESVIDLRNWNWET